jgi:hypothetical protein
LLDLVASERALSREAAITRRELSSPHVSKVTRPEHRNKNRGRVSGQSEDDDHRGRMPLETVDDSGCCERKRRDSAERQEGRSGA